MQMQKFFNKKVTVMGIGLHGGAVEVIRWFLSEGAKVIATDLRSAEELKPSLEKLKGLKNLEIVTGIHRVEDFERVDLVVKNPAIRWDNAYIQRALKKKIPVEVDSSLFFQYCPSPYIIGITGTKGKTTTSLLIYEILKISGRKAVLVGVGQEGVIGKLKNIDEKTWVVFELSSWRLSALKRQKKSPHGAVIVNFLQDHLNYYRDMNEYATDKKAIFQFQKENDWLVINENALDDLGVKQDLGKILSSKRKIAFFPEKKDEVKNCVFVEGDSFCFFWEGKKQYLGKIRDLKLKGKHNWNNVMAAIAVGLFLGCLPEKIWQAVIQFVGARHRLELVCELNGVKFYNDTAATTPEAGQKGILSFNQPLHLIAGGSNKNLDLTNFAKEIALNSKIKKVYLLEGGATEDLKKKIELFGAQEKIFGIFKNIEEAVKMAFRNALSGEAVLLSPGCASFGMFQNEFDRGEKFCQAVLNLKPVTKF